PAPPGASPRGHRPDDRGGVAGGFGPGAGGDASSRPGRDRHRAGDVEGVGPGPGGYSLGDGRLRRVAGVSAGAGRRPPRMTKVTRMTSLHITCTSDDSL